MTPEDKINKTIWVLSLIAVPVVIVIAFFLLVPGAASWIKDHELERRRVEVEQVRDEQVRMVAYDKTGGKTPEETLNLFLASLRAKNSFLADKYYEYSLQFAMLNKLQVELSKYSDLHTSENFFYEVIKNGNKTCDSLVEECWWQYQGKIIDLKLNPITKVWKISIPR